MYMESTAGMLIVQHERRGSTSRYYGSSFLHFYFLPPFNSLTLIRYLGTSQFAAKGKKSPVFLYCGNEGSADDFYNASGAMFEHAEALGAHVLFVEHRFGL